MSIEPITSVEMLINAIVENAGTTEITAVSRIELFLTDILMGRVSEIPPITRIEMYLAAISGADVDPPDPITRVEMFLAKIAGQDVEPPEPISRLEMFLADWADQGGIYEVTVSGTSPLILAAAMSHALHSLTQYGLCVQNGTPTPSAPVDIMCNNGVLKYGALGSNLYDPSTAVFEVGYYYNPTGGGAKTAAPNNYIYYAYIPVEAGEAYVFYGRRKTGNSLSQYNRIHWYDAEKTYISTNTYVGGTMGKGVAPNNAAYARLSCNPLGTTASITEETVLGYNWTFCKGTEEITPFVPFVGGIYCGGTHPKKNLYNPASAWLFHTPIGFGSGSASWPNAEEETYPNSITYFMRVTPNTTYTYSCATAGDGFGVCGENGVVDPSSYTTSNQLTFDSVLVPLKSSSVGKTYSFTTGANTQMIAVYCALNTAPTNIQIEEGSTATDYEPYTETPYQPEVLTVSGANLLDPSTSSITIGQYYNANGTLVNGVNNWRTGLIPITGGKTYAFWGRAKADNTISAYNRINWFTANKTHISPRPSYTLDTVTVGTAPSNAAFATLSCSPFDSDDAITREQFDLYNWMFAEASEEIPYQPYVTPQTVGWKNLFDASSYTEINAYVNANTGVLTNGSPGSMTQYCAVIPCKPNTQYNITGQGTSAWGAFTSDSIGTTATAFTKGGNLTTGANDRYLIGLVRANGDSIDYRNTLVVRETVTDIPMLLGVGDYKDEIELVVGPLTHKVGVYVITGDESGWGASSTAGIYTLAVGFGKGLVAICTHFRNVPNTTSAANMGDGTFKGHSTNNIVYFKDSSAETLDAFKAKARAAYASGNPWIIVYALSTETTEQTTPQHLVTHKGTNVVEAQANVEPIALEAVYASDTPAE